MDLSGVNAVADYVSEIRCRVTLELAKNCNSAFCALVECLWVSSHATCRRRCYQCNDNYSLKTGITNDLFSVKITSTSSGFNCTFMKEQVTGATWCTCTVNISYGKSCSTLLGEYSSSGPIGPVIVTVLFHNDVQQYCYVASGTCGGKIAVVEGTLNFAVISKFCI